MKNILSDEDLDALLKQSEDAIAKRAEKMPDERSAIDQMLEAYQRLRELGWNDVIYCPKDGTIFSAIEAGSGGIHKCNYTGEWPDGSWWIYDGDMWPSRPILWRETKESDPNIDHGLAMDYKCCENHD